MTPLGAMPIVKVELEGVKASMLHYLHTHNLEVEERLEAALTRAMEGLDWEEEITKQAEYLVSSIVRRAVSDAIASALADAAIKTQLERMAKVAARAWLEKAGRE